MRTNSIRALCALIGIGTIATPTSGQCTLEPTGELRTLPGEFAVNSRYAFVYLNGELVAYDLSAAGTPLRVGQLPFNYVAGITLVGDLAFVASEGLRIVDISDPTAMQVVGVFAGLDESERPSGTPLYYQGLVCAISGLNSLLVFDVSDPTQPGLRSNSEISTPNAEVMAFEAGRAYVLAADVLSIWDVLSAPAPLLAGEYDFGAWVGSFAVRAYRAYASVGSGAPRIF